MTQLGLEREIVDRKARANSIGRFREAGIRLPTFAELADPALIPDSILGRLSSVDPDAADPLNLFRVHWFNKEDRRARADLPEHVVLPSSLTGVEAQIVVLLGNRFPLIRAHKVLAAYGCLVPRIVTGQFDPTAHRAVWPSTGNYCRGGVAISRILGCRGVAVLPEGMSRERFDWLSQWVVSPSDLIRTRGTESNVKEIYDRCHELDRDPANVIMNQFSEFGNHLIHLACTGRACSRVFDLMSSAAPGLRLAAFVSATGSAGTLGAGDLLKEEQGARIAAVEALECPTMLYNGYGGHNIQGIGDRHIPLIMNVMNTDVAVAVSDRSTDALNVLFGTEEGIAYLAERRRVPARTLAALPWFGLSGICNLVASIKTAKHLRCTARDVILTIATDEATMYKTEREKAVARIFPGGFDRLAAAEVFGEHLLGAGTDHLIELSQKDRERIFNLGYFTWVEQQGVPLQAFEARRSQETWRELRDLIPIWDGMIEAFNAETGLGGLE